MPPDYLTCLGWLAPPPENFKERLADALPSAVNLRHLAMHGLSEAQLTQLGRALIKARKAGNMPAGLTPFRLVILSNATTDHLTAPLVGTALRYGIALDIQSYSYDDSFSVAVGEDPRLRDFAPDAALIAIDHNGLPVRETFGDDTGEQDAIARATDYLQAIVDGVRRKTGAACIMQTVPASMGTGFGHAERKTAGSMGRILDGVNRRLAEAAKNDGAVLFDLAALVEKIGSSRWRDQRLWNLGKMPFALEYVPLYADHLCRVIGAMRGKSRRVLVLDLDNTLWGGVVGDDGVEALQIGNGSAAGEAFLEFQRSALSLRSRGILLAVSSKNDDAQARRPFREIPDMALREESFVAFRANWQDKAANIAEMAAELSLGLDAFVFVDDNPAERALVRRFLPDVAVPELPDDPSAYAFALDAAGYFEATSFSGEDARRSELYRGKAALAKVSPNDLNDYLLSLDMQLAIESVTAANRARVVQLINKSNQFNLTTRRMTDEDVQRVAGDKECATFVLRLADRLDDHGIISVIMCEKTDQALEIFLWVMSCRVIGRGVEKAALSFLKAKAKQAGCRRIAGTYIPTDRNKMVANHYAALGFSPSGEGPDGATGWALTLDDETPASGDVLAMKIRDDTGAS